MAILENRLEFTGRPGNLFVYKLPGMKQTIRTKGAAGKKRRF